MKRLCKTMLSVLVGAAVVLTLLILLGGLHWRLELLTHFSKKSSPYIS